MTVRILVGDVREQLATLPDASVHCVVTSPPYWGLRDYGVAGQIGLEAAPDEFIATMTAVFREVRRVLRADGTCWVNMGDSYAANRSYQVPSTLMDGDATNQAQAGAGLGMKASSIGLKPKDLVGIPWRLAFALQDDGWYLRQDIIWHKPNPMPESVRDRCTKSHEYIFLLSKSERYYFDQEAIGEPCESGESDLRKMREQKERIGGKHKTLVDPLSMASSATNIGRKRSVGDGETRNKRSVWTITTRGFSEAHFATFPPELPETCIKAGCPAGGVVLDPFFGAGTTGLVADRLGRDCIGIELNPEYAEMARRRIAADCPLFTNVGQEGLDNVR